jgi:replication factor A3
MDTSAPAPRVNGELLARFVGRKVLLVGKAESLEGNVMRLRTSDDRVVSVELKGGAAGYSSDYVEFEAVVKSADSVREEEHTSFGSAFGACPCLAPATRFAAQ